MTTDVVNHGPRDGAIDICRGMAIAAVIVVHVCGHFLGRLAIGSALWALDVTINRAGTLAVPAFLMVTACLLGRKTWPLPPRARIAVCLRRLPLVALVYLAASALFLAVDAHNDRSALNARHVEQALITGKAAFHLYFLMIRAQLIALYPLLVVLMRREWSFARAAAVAALAQAAVYVCNRWIYTAPEPGTLAGWYVAPILLGAWLGGRPESSTFTMTTTRRLLTISAIGLALYLPVFMMQLAGRTVDTALFQVTEWTYTTSAALTLFAVSQRTVHARLTHVFIYLGRRSLSIYLLHPLAVELLDHLAHRGELPQRTVLLMPLYALACFVLPLAASHLFAHCRELLSKLPVPVRTKRVARIARGNRPA